MKKLRNYYSYTVTVTRDDGTFFHHLALSTATYTDKEAERLLEQAPNRFELVKEPKPKGVKNGK